MPAAAKARLIDGNLCPRADEQHHVASDQRPRPAAFAIVDQHATDHRPQSLGKLRRLLLATTVNGLLHRLSQRVAQGVGRPPPTLGEQFAGNQRQQFDEAR